ncbi:MAG: hypothetical protein QMB88_00240, partial [Burkholderiaceae bacterium]
ACTRGDHCGSGNQQVTVTVPAPAPAPQIIEVGGAPGWVVKPKNALYDNIAQASARRTNWQPNRPD